MLTANLYANADDALDYAGKPTRAVADGELTGLARGTGSTARPTAGCSWPSTSDDEWRRAWTAIDRPELADDPRFATATPGRPTPRRSTVSWPTCS